MAGSPPLCLQAFAMHAACLLLCLRPGRRGAANKVEGKLKVPLVLAASPQGSAVYVTDSSFR